MNPITTAQGTAGTHVFTRLFRRNMRVAHVLAGGRERDVKK